MTRRTRQSVVTPFSAPDWPAAQKPEMVKVALITPHPKNPRIHPDGQLNSLGASFDEFGVVWPIVVDDNYRLMAGEGRWLTAKKKGFEEYPCIVIRGWSESKKLRFMVADNRLPQLAGFDNEVYRAAMKLIKDDGLPIESLGFDEATLLALMTPPYVENAAPADEIVPDVPKNPVTRKGDIWMLGDHRLICGDCRDAADVARLVGKDKINIGFTSPPYAEQRDYDASSGFVPINPDDYVEWFGPVSENVASHLAPDGSFFVNIKPAADGLDTDLYVFDLVIAHVRKWGWHFATEFCWERNGVPKSVTRRFKNQYEPVYQFARGDWKMRPRAVMHLSENVPIPGGPGFGKDAKKNMPARRKKGFPTGEGSQGTDWQKGAPLGIPMDEIGEGMAYPGNRLPTFAASHEATGHAAAFPVGLPGFFIKAYSDVGDFIYDPFMGSGSTLIAAHRAGRVGLGVEISPSYCDVIVERWQRASGKKAKRIPHKK